MKYFYLLSVTYFKLYLIVHYLIPVSLVLFACFYHNLESCEILLGTEGHLLLRIMRITVCPYQLGYTYDRSTEISYL